MQTVDYPVSIHPSIVRTYRLVYLLRKLTFIMYLTMTFIFIIVLLRLVYSNFNHRYKWHCHQLYHHQQVNHHHHHRKHRNLLGIRSLLLCHILVNLWSLPLFIHPSVVCTGMNNFQMNITIISTAPPPSS